MRQILALLVALCLVNFVLTKPIPEGDEEATSDGTTEEPKDAEATSDGAENDDKKEEGAETDKDEEKEDDDGEPSADDPSKGNPEKSEGEGDGAATEQGEDEAESPKSDKGEGDDAKNDPLETYNKVIELLDKVKVDNVENGYERSELSADIQRYLRNPLVAVIGHVGNFSKIASCFKSLVGDAKNAIEDDIKAFKECTSKKDSDAYQCSQNRSSVQDKISKISSKISSCVNSSKS